MNTDRRTFLKIVGFGSLGLIAAPMINKLITRIPQELQQQAETITEDEAVFQIEKMTANSPPRFVRVPILSNPPTVRMLASLPSATLTVPTSVLEINIGDLVDKIQELHYKALEQNRRPWAVIVCPEHERALSYASDYFYLFSYKLDKPRIAQIMGMDLLRSEVLDYRDSPILV